MTHMKRKKGFFLQFICKTRPCEDVRGTSLWQLPMTGKCLEEKNLRQAQLSEWHTRESEEVSRKRKK